jgi:hypothetical protein
VLSVFLLVPYWLGKPFKHSAYKHDSLEEIKQRFSRHYFDHFAPRVMVSIILIIGGLISLPKGLMVVLTLLMIMIFTAILVDVFLLVCRMMYEKIDQVERDLEAKELGTENLPVPVGYYQDASYTKIVKNIIDEKYKDQAEKSERIAAFQNARNLE